MHRYFLLITQLSLLLLWGCAEGQTNPPEHATKTEATDIEKVIIAPENSTPANTSISFSGPSLVWERQNGYVGSRQVWDPSTTTYQSINHNDVYEMDSAPYRLWTDRPELWFPNYRCMHESLTDPLGWHRTPAQISSDWSYGAGNPSWCQRIDFNPWYKSTQYYSNNNRWWTMATAATWTATQLWNGASPTGIALIRFTENKTMFGQDNVLRRGPFELSYHGYVNWKMDGTATSPANTNPADDTADGYYMGFVTLSMLPQNADNNWGKNAMAIDQGPIVWPKRGYRQWRSDLGIPPNHGSA